MNVGRREDKQFIWIAEKARDAVFTDPLPPPWRSIRARGGRPEAFHNPVPD